MFTGFTDEQHHDQQEQTRAGLDQLLQLFVHQITTNFEDFSAFAAN